jgi:hypothetical protein
MNGRASSIDVRCPSCGARALFEEPFEFVPAGRFEAEERRPWHRWGGWVVIERFPSEASWSPPASSHQYLRWGGDETGEGYPLLTNGVVHCPRCHVNGKRRLDWPADAYWRWEVRGETLWAWDEAHARAILAYVSQAIRPSRRAPSLRYVPSHFLSAKVRDLVVKLVTESLERERKG